MLRGHGTIEPVFGNLINYYGMRKINVKGIKGAHKVMLLAAIAYNLRKWMKYITKKANVKVQALQGQLCGFAKTLVFGFIRSFTANANFSLPPTRL